MQVAKISGYDQERSTMRTSLPIDEEEKGTLRNPDQPIRSKLKVNQSKNFKLFSKFINAVCVFV